MRAIDDKVKDIVCGMEVYFRTFALADTMCLQDAGDIEWIAPKPTETGPAVVFRVALDERTLKTRLAQLAPELQAGVIPGLLS